MLRSAVSTNQHNRARSSQVLQLGLGMGVFVPAGAALGGFGEVGAAGAATVTGVMAGTIGVAGTMSWYCERLVGEISWRPAERALRISTLTMVCKEVHRPAALRSPRHPPHAGMPSAHTRPCAAVGQSSRP